MGKLNQALGRAKSIGADKPAKAKAKAPEPPKKQAARSAPEEPDEKPPVRARRGRPVKAARKPEKKPAPAKADPAATIDSARARIRTVLKDIVGESPKVAIGLVLAIVTQETGNHAAADLLIEEYGLEETFGMKPSRVKSKKLQR